MNLQAISQEVAFDDKAGRLANRDTIERFMAAMKVEAGERDYKGEINESGLKEHFVGGAYIRQLLIPKSTALVSELWNKDRFWIITEGEVDVFSELGRQKIVAPYYGLAPFGTRIALVAIEDTMWFAITGAKAENPEDIEKEVIVKDHKELPYPWDSEEVV